MAARRKKNGQFVGGGTTTVPNPGTLVILDQDGPAPLARAPTRRRRSRRKAKSTSADTLMRDVIAGASYGLAERLSEDFDIPQIPYLGRKGTIALALYLLRDQHPMIAEAARAGIIISSYELLAEGKVTGE